MPLLYSDKDWNDYVAHGETIARGAGFRHLRDSILERASIRPGETVLDVGSGTGLLTLPSAAVAEKVWAVDISSGMCGYLDTKARSAGLVNVEPVVASAASIPLVDEVVDVAVSNYCFHHLDAAGKMSALAEVHRVLAPGGRLVLGDMMFSLQMSDDRNRQVLRSKIRAMLAKGPAGVLRLVRNGIRVLSGRWEKPATPEWWRGALADAGFEAVRVEALDHEGGIASARKGSSPA